MHRTMIATSTILLALATHAAAQDWPTRPMTLVVPFSAGGGVDVSARIQAQRMGELLGQTNTSLTVPARYNFERSDKESKRYSLWLYPEPAHAEPAPGAGYFFSNYQNHYKQDQRN
jgi:hypothetical protein